MENKSSHGIDTDFMTVGRYILMHQQKHPDASGELSHLLQSIMVACKTLSMAVRKAGITKIFGLSGDINKTGDNQQKLDVVANDLFVNMINSSRTTSILVSEELDDIICDISNKNCKYIVAFDPLDGSSNIDCLASIGSIFGVWRKVGDTCDQDNYLQPGRRMVAAGYVLYGSATMLVLALNNMVSGFTLDPSIGEFIMTNYDMKIPEVGSIFSINEGSFRDFDDSLKCYLNYIKGLESNKKMNEKFNKIKAPYKARYVGSMVSDVHRTLVYGGIFIYPGTKSTPNGKLRLLYECAPMAFIIENAGGLAVTPHTNVLDIVPTDIHQKAPLFIGSKLDVEFLQSFYKNK